ncbi:MAG: hypothetical protein P9M14_08820 [Candidatus Alcyoniella australis]|nr:hypothetical protein [Candidatus Alcyoniella australis]
MPGHNRMPVKNYYRPSEVYKHFDIPKSTFYDMLQTETVLGRAPGGKMGSRILIPRAEVVKLEKMFQEDL